MIPRLRDILDALETMAPLRLAESWDNPGLQVGRPEDEVAAVFVSLDPTIASLRRAKDAGAQLLLTHHPLLFRPLTQVNADRYPGQIVVEAARLGIGVACAHTNLDAAEGGINDILAELLGLERVEVLEDKPGKESGLTRLVICAAAECEERLRSALWEGLERGSWRILAGTGAKRGSDRGIGEGPSSGSPMESPPDQGCCPMEIIVSDRALSRAVRIIKGIAGKGALDGYSHRVFEVCGRNGMGRIGDLDGPILLMDMVHKIVETLGARFVIVLGEREKEIRRMAVVGGSGGSWVSQAFHKGADLLLTGDVGYHHAMEALGLGISVVDCSHFYAEKTALNVFAGRLGDALRRDGWEVTVQVDSVEADPRYWVAAPGVGPLEGATRQHAR